MASERDSTEKILRIPVHKMLVWAAAVLAAVIGATFAATMLFNSSHVAALETRLQSASEQLQAAREDAARAKIVTPTAPSPNAPSPAGPSLALPPAIIAASSDPETARKLQNRVAELESERILLVGELAKISRDALDPTSELGNLLSLLTKGTRDQQEQAIHALLEMKDPRSYLPLFDYYRKDPSKAQGVLAAQDWFSLFFSFGEKRGVMFLVDQIESDDPLSAELAFAALNGMHFTKEDHEYATSQLESVALRSQDASARARAKLILKHFREAPSDNIITPLPATK